MAGLIRSRKSRPISRQRVNWSHIETTPKKNDIMKMKQPSCVCDGTCPRCISVQPKLKVNQSYDHYEQEADKIANHAIDEEQSKSFDNPSSDYSSQDQNMPQPSTSQSIYTQLETTKGKGQALSPALSQVGWVEERNPTIQNWTWPKMLGFAALNPTYENFILPERRSNARQDAWSLLI